MADIVLKILLTNNRSKRAFAYYRDRMSDQANGEYSEALANDEEALKLEDNPNGRRRFSAKANSCSIVVTKSLFLESPQGDFFVAIMIRET